MGLSFSSKTPSGTTMNSDDSSSASESADIKPTLVDHTGEIIDHESLRVLSEGDQSFNTSAGDDVDYDIGFSDLSVIDVDGRLHRVAVTVDPDGRTQHHIISIAQEKELIKEHLTEFPTVKQDWAAWSRLVSVPPDLSVVFGPHCVLSHGLKAAEMAADAKKKEAAKKRQAAAAAKRKRDAESKLAKAPKAALSVKSATNSPAGKHRHRGQSKVTATLKPVDASVAGPSLPGTSSVPDVVVADTSDGKSESVVPMVSTSSVTPVVPAVPAVPAVPLASTTPKITIQMTFSDMDIMQAFNQLGYVRAT